MLVSGVREAPTPVDDPWASGSVHDLLAEKSGRSNAGNSDEDMVEEILIAPNFKRYIVICISIRAVRGDESSALQKSHSETLITGASSSLLSKGKEKNQKTRRMSLCYHQTQASWLELGCNEPFLHCEFGTRGPALTEHLILTSHDYF